MGTTDNAEADTAVKNLQDSHTPQSPLSGSVGFGGDNNPDAVLQVSEALVANGRLDQSTSDATDAFNSKIITAQQDMADGLKPDGLINPGGPTENRFTNLVQGGMMKAPAVTPTPRPATGSRAGNAAVTASTKATDIDAARAQALQNASDPNRTSFLQAQDVKRLNKAKADAAAANARAERLDTKAREKAQHEQIMAAQKARQQATEQSANQSRQVKDTATKLVQGVTNLLGNAIPSSTKPRQSRAGESPSPHPETVDPGLRRGDVRGGAVTPPITDEVFSANRRSTQYLASRTDMQDFPRWEIEDINTQGAPAIAKTADLIEQTHDIAPDQAKRLYERTIKGINPDAQGMLDEILGQTPFGGAWGPQPKIPPYSTVYLPVDDPSPKNQSREKLSKSQPHTDELVGAQAEERLIGGSGTEWAFRKVGEQIKQAIEDTSQDVEEGIDWAISELDKRIEPLRDIGSATFVNVTDTDREVKDNLLALSKKYRAKGYTRAADNLDHFLGGSGDDITITRDKAREDPFIALAEEKSRDRFETGTFLGKTKKNDPVNDGLRNLKDGETINLADDWDRKRDRTDTYADLTSKNIHVQDDALAEGVKNFHSAAEFTATRRGNKIVIRGTVKHGGEEPYDFETDGLGHLMGAKSLSDHKIAKNFSTIRKWGQSFEGTVDVQTGPNGNILSNPKFDWWDTWKDVDPDKFGK